MPTDDRADRSARARARHDTADDVMATLGLMTRWRALGEPVVVGSVALDVVVRRHLDIEVYADGLSPTAGFAVVVPLCELPHVRRIRYLDARDSQMSGLYWKIEYEVPGGDRWTVDNWVFPRSEASVRESTGMIRAALDVDADARDGVLAIKEAAVERGERAHGRWVYEAVLGGGVRSYVEYLDWLGDRDVWARSEWTPG